MSFVLSLTQMLVLLSLYVMLSILLSILVCAAALVFPVHINQPMFTLVLVLGVSVLDVPEYLIGENAKYLYLYLITST